VAVELTTDFPFDPEIQSYVVKRCEEWIVSVTPMIYNDRVILSMKADYPWGWTAGWCYDKGGAAFLAALAWDPDTEDAPVGFKKLAGDARNR